MTPILIASATTKFWVGVVLLFIIGVGYLAAKTTRGLAGGYLRAPISDWLTATLAMVHGLGALILALIIPNNFLVKIPWFRDLYAQDGLWIAVSIVVLLFLFLVAIGMLFTLLTGRVRK